MALTETEAKMLNQLNIKKDKRLTSKDFEIMSENVDNLYDYQRSFSALMVWNGFCNQLSILADDNAKLIKELKLLQDDKQIVQPAPVNLSNEQI